jgi:3-hydroxyisobutyrate dehydrogenase
MSSFLDADHAEISIVGLGEIGGGIARHLAGAGTRVAGFDIAQAALDRARDAGVRIAMSVAHAAALAPVVATSLPSEAAVRAVYLGPEGLVAAGARVVTCDLSTVPVALAREIAEARQSAGGRHVEGALIGVGKDAEAGQMHFMFAGDEAAVRSLAPLLRAGGKGHVRFDRPGDAILAKILNNGVGQATLAAVAEALALAEATGLSRRELVASMLRGQGAGHSVVLERHGRAMAADEDGPGPGALAVKDAKALAEALGPHRPALPILGITAETLIGAMAVEKCGRQGVALTRQAVARVASGRSRS